MLFTYPQEGFEKIKTEGESSSSMISLFSDCQGTFTPECQRSIRSASKEIGIIQCWGRPLYAYCKATDGTVFPIPGFNCEHSTCPDDAKGQIATGELK